MSQLSDGEHVGTYIREAEVTSLQTTLLHREHIENIHLFRLLLQSREYAESDHKARVHLC